MIPIPGTAYLLAAAFTLGALSAYKIMDWKADAERTQQLEGAITVLDEAHKQARAKEREHAVEINAIDTKLTRERQNAKKETDRLNKLVDDGKLRLRDPGNDQPAGDRGVPGATATSPSRSDGPATCELSTKAARFLLDLTAEADTVAQQLQACQQVLIEDRR